MQKLLMADPWNGAQVAFALAELAPSFTDQFILIAHRQDNQLIIPYEKVYARWANKTLTFKWAVLPSFLHQCY